MPNLEGFFSRTFPTFYLVTGAETALIGAFAFFPSWATPAIARLPFLIDYTIIIQHWGIMVGLMGLFMMGAAIVPQVAGPDRPLKPRREGIHGMARSFQRQATVRRWLLDSICDRLDGRGVYRCFFMNRGPSSFHCAASRTDDSDFPLGFGVGLLSLQTLDKSA